MPGPAATPPGPTGAHRVVEALEQLGVEVAFGLPGVHNLAIWKALSTSSIRLVGVRHEQAAAYAADGYARASGRLGVALVTTGPGAANTLGATGEAMASGSPVLIIATDIPVALRREGVYRGVLHETRDQAAMFAPVTKAASRVDTADRLAEAVRASARAALAPPSGPVYLGIPTDLLGQRAAPEPAADSPAPAVVPVLASPAELDRAAEMLARAHQPLLWAGGGALRADAGELIGELALRLAAPVLTTYASRGLIRPEHPCAVRGPAHAPPVGALWDEADVVLAVGSDLDGMMTQNWLMPQPPVLIAVNVDAADAGKNYRTELTLVGDARAILEELLPRVSTRRDGEPLRRRLAAIAAEIAADIEVDEPAAARLLAVLDRALPGDAVVLADMCVAGYWLAGYRTVPAPRKLLYPVGWGTLGFAFPASLGAALAGAGPVLCVCGDGGFLFACGELATLAELRVPLTIVLVDDSGYGMLRFDQLQAGEDPFGVDLATPDFVTLAGAFGIPASAVDGFGPEFEAALDSALAGPGPQMLVVRARLKPPPVTSPRWYRRGGEVH